jgi:alpha-mannosidase
MELANLPLRKVIVVFKTHFDLGFTALPDEVMSLYTGEMFSAVREVMTATANEPEGSRYTWTLPSWPLKQLLYNPTVPQETRDAAHDLVRKGRLHWHAWPFTTHTAFCELEELVRGLHISRILSDEFGRSPIAAKQTDVPGHTWIYPSLLVHAGVKFLHLGVNPGSHSPHVPTLFWWEGPDGARLLTWYSHGGYGSSLLPPDDWPLDTWLAVLLTVENTGPQPPEELRQIRAYIEEHAPSVEVQFGQLDDFANSVFEKPEQLTNLPVIPYDLADTWIHGIGTMPREVARVRALRSKLLELECIAACFQWGDGKEIGQPDFPLLRQMSPHIDEAYEQLLLFGEHTWGLDVKSTIKRVFGPDLQAARQTEPYRRLESSWVAKGEYVNRAEAAYTRATELLREGWRIWSESPELEQRRKERDELMEKWYSQQSRPDVSEDLVQEVAPEPYVLENPELKYGVAPTSPTVLEIGNLRIEVDPSSGGIVSLRQLDTGREWVDRTNPEPFGGYRYDIYSAADIAEHLRSYGRLFQEWFIQDFGKSGYPEDVPHVTAYARDFDISQGEYGSLLLKGGTLRAEGPGSELLPAQSINIEITRMLELIYTIEGKEATPLAESTVVPLPLHLPKATFRLGQTGSVIDPARDIAEGANRNLWCADWIDISDDRIGMAIMAKDMPLISIGDTGIYRFEPGRLPNKPVVYAHLFNTQWGTNFPQWLEGDFTFRVGLEPHRGDWRGDYMWEQRYPSSSPLRDLQPEGERGICDLFHYIQLSKGLVLQSMRPRRDGQGLIVRYWDALGMRRGDIVKLWGPIAKVWRCDLMERPIEQLRTKLLAKDEDANVPVTYVFTEVAAHGVETMLIEFGSDT